MNNLELTIAALKQCVPADVFDAAMRKAEEENAVLVSNARELEAMAEDLLTQVGIPSHILGFRFLAIGLTLIIKEPSLAYNVTKQLYPRIAEEFGATTKNRVERGIRHAIETAWSTGDDDELRKYFGNGVSFLQGRPTNSAFMVRAATLLKREFEKKGGADCV